MAYTDFTLDDLLKQFGLRFTEVPNLFAKVPSAPIDAWLPRFLEENSPLALDMSTEKARSEMIIAPILLEARRQRRTTVSLFSGMEFPVDPARGLTGFCDFLFSQSPRQIEIEAPVVVIVEAKNENIRRGVPQCIAEMFAASLFNAQRERDVATVYGAVTTGGTWRFLRLQGQDIELDLAEYYLREVERIMGVLLYMLSATKDQAQVGANQA